MEGGGEKGARGTRYCSSTSWRSAKPKHETKRKQVSRSLCTGANVNVPATTTTTPTSNDTDNNNGNSNSNCTNTTLSLRTTTTPPPPSPPPQNLHSRSRAEPLVFFFSPLREEAAAAAKKSIAAYLRRGGNPGDENKRKRFLFKIQQPKETETCSKQSGDALLVIFLPLREEAAARSTTSLSLGVVETQRRGKKHQLPNKTPKIDIQKSNIKINRNALEAAWKPLFLLSHPCGKKLRQGVPRRFLRVQVEIFHGGVAENRQVH